MTKQSVMPPPSHSFSAARKPILVISLLGTVGSISQHPRTPRPHQRIQGSSTFSGYALLAQVAVSVVGWTRDLEVPDSKCYEDRKEIARAF